MSLVHFIIRFCDLEDRRREIVVSVSRFHCVNLTTMITNLLSISTSLGVWGIIVL